jgi:hypothetical protein
VNVEAALQLGRLGQLFNAQRLFAKLALEYEHRDLNGVRLLRPHGAGETSCAGETTASVPVIVDFWVIGAVRAE